MDLNLRPSKPKVSMSNCSASGLLHPDPVLHLIWYHCPSSAHYTLILQRERIASPLRLDLRSQEWTSNRQDATGQAQPPVVCPSRQGHFTALVLLQQLRKDWSLPK